MSRTFAIIESGIVKNCIIADEWPGAVDVSGMTPRPAAGWTYDGEAFAPPAPVAPVIATTPRITHFGFLSRLTPQERTAVRAATAGDPILDDAMFLFN